MGTDLMLLYRYCQYKKNIQFGMPVVKSRGAGHMESGDDVLLRSVKQGILSRSSPKTGEGIVFIGVPDTG